MAVSTDRRQGVNSSAAVKVPCRVATTAAITLSGLQSIDGVTVAADDRVLVKDQSTASENGIYNASSSTWQRAPDCDGYFDLKRGTLVHVHSGSTYATTWFTVTTSDPITIGTSNISFTATQLTDQLAAQLADASSASLGDALVAVKRTDTGAVATTQHQANEVAELNLLVFDNTIDTTGAVDVSAKVQTALDTGLAIYVPEGTYKINSKLTTSAGQSIRGASRRLSRFKKGANGYMLNLNTNCEIMDVGFDGSMANFTGGCIEIDLGANSTDISLLGAQHITECDFADVDGYAVDYTTAHKGFLSKVERCYFGDTNADAAVKWPDENTTTGNRSVIDCYSLGPIINLGGCDNGMVQNNLIGDSTTGVTASHGAVFPTGTTNRAKKVQFLGNRFALGGNTMTIRGVELIFVGNNFAGNVTLASNAANDGLINSIFKGNDYAGFALIDSSADDNEVDMTMTAYNAGSTPALAWTAVSANPAIGNGSLAANFARSGRQVTVSYHIVMGASTTFGTGGWKLSIPFAAGPRATTMNGYAYDSSANTYYSIFSQIAADSQVMFLLVNGGTNVTSAVPFTWAQSDELVLTGTYFT